MNRIARLVILLLLVATSAPRAVASPLTRVYRDFHARIVMRYPATWHANNKTVSPVIEPFQRVVLYSGMRVDSSRAPRSAQVAAILVEATQAVDLSRFPRRPRRFRLSGVGRMEGFSGSRWSEIIFRDHRRGFVLFVWVGRDVGSTARAQLLHSLDSLSVG
jgi:hypothetical protein